MIAPFTFNDFCTVKHDKSETHGSFELRRSFRSQAHQLNASRQDNTILHRDTSQDLHSPKSRCQPLQILLLSRTASRFHSAVQPRFSRSSGCAPLSAWRYSVKPPSSSRSAFSRWKLKRVTRLSIHSGKANVQIVESQRPCDRAAAFYEMPNASWLWKVMIA